MADDGVVIKISGDTADIEAAFKKLGELFQNSKQQASQFGETGKIAVGVFAGELAGDVLKEGFTLLKEGFEFAIDKIHEFVVAGSEAQQAIGKLNVSLALAGKYNEDASESVQKYNESLSENSKFTVQQINQNSGLIESYAKLDENGLKRATKAAIDFASVTGKPLEEVSSALGRAAATNITHLSRLGIVIEATGDKTKDFARALDLIEKKFGGGAQAALQGYEGNINQATKAHEELTVQTGLTIVSNDALIAAIKATTETFIFLKKSSEENKEAIDSLVTDGINVLVDALGLANKSIAIFLDFISLMDVGITRVENVIASVVGKFFDFAESLREAEAAVAKFIGKEDVAKALEEDAAAAKLASESLNEYKEANDKAAEDFVAANEKRKESIDKVYTFAKGAYDKNLENQKQLSEGEKETFLEGLNKKGEIASQKSAEQLEVEKKFSAALIENTRSTQGRIQAEAFRHQIQLLVSEGKYQEALRKIKAQEVKNHQDSVFAIQQYEELTQKQKLQNFESTLNQIATLQNSGNRAAFELGKQASAADAVIKGVQAVQVALASAPPPFNFALAAIVGAIAATNVAKIESTQFKGAAEGGLLEGGVPGRDSIPVLAQQNEIIAPARSFDEVVEGTARQRGFTKNGEGGGNDDVVSKLEDIHDALLNRQPDLHVSVQGDVVGEQAFVQSLGRALSNEVRHRNLNLGGF